MSLHAGSPARPVSTAATASLARVRRGSLAVLVLLVVEYGIGMYVNLYVTIPRADHGRGLGSAIANGPAMLSIHAVIGLLLGLGALAVVVQAVMHRTLIPPVALQRWGPQAAESRARDNPRHTSGETIMSTTESATRPAAPPGRFAVGSTGAAIRGTGQPER